MNDRDSTDNPQLEQPGALIPVKPNDSLPSPAILTEYNQVQPGLAERMVAIAEQEQAHRHQMESQLAQLQAADRQAERTARLRAQIFALSLGITAIVAGSAIAIVGRSVVGCTISCSGIAGFVLVFILSRWMPRSQED